MINGLLPISDERFLKFDLKKVSKIYFLSLCKYPLSLLLFRSINLICPGQDQDSESFMQNVIKHSFSNSSLKIICVCLCVYINVYCMCICECVSLCMKSKGMLKERGKQLNNFKARVKILINFSLQNKKGQPRSFSYIE